MTLGRVSRSQSRLARLALFGLAVLVAAEARAQCIRPSCDEPLGDVAHCSFALQPQTTTSAVSLSFTQDPSYEVDRPVLPLSSDREASAQITVHRNSTNLGLIQLRGTATGLPPECARIALPLDFLQPDTIRLVVRGRSVYDKRSPAPAEALKLGLVEPFELAIVDSRDLPVSVPVPLTFALRVVDASADVGTSEERLRSEPIPVLLPARQSSQFVFIRPHRPGTGRLLVELKLDQSARTLANSTVSFQTEHRQGSRAGFVLLGGLCYWLLTLLARFAKGARTVAPMTLAGTLAACGLGFFLQAQLPLWGFAFRADPTQLGSQFILGVVLAGLGTEGLLGLIKGGAGPAPAGKPALAAPGAPGGS